jgi:hypothetical protein
MALGSDNVVAARRFRRWLAERVAETSWVWGCSVTNRELAQQLGVDPEIIVDARRYLDRVERERCERSGAVLARVGRNGRPKVVDHTKDLVVRTPQYVFAEWHKLMELRGIHGTTAMRSLIHYVLSHPEYRPTRQFWYYQGKRHYVGPEMSHRWYIRVTLPSGLWAVLARRSKSLRMHKVHLCRDLILDFMEGKIPANLPLITNIEQFWDPSRYVAGDESLIEAARGSLLKRKRVRKKKEPSDDEGRTEGSVG